MAQWRRTVEALSRWVVEEVAGTPDATTPMVFGDLNSGTIGPASFRDAVGPFPRGIMSLSGRTLAEWASQGGFVFANSFHRVGPSCRSKNRASFPDQIIIQDTALVLLKKVAVSNKTAARLQYSPHFKDHAPIFYDWQLALPIHQTSPPKKSLFHGFARGRSSKW